MKELVIVNNWERLISNAIRMYKDNEDFPKLSDYDIKKSDFDDYLVEKQYLLDRLETRKSSFVVPGALLILPVVVISMFTDSVTGLLSGLAAGIIFASAYILVLNAMDKKNLKKLYDGNIEKYIDDILNYRQSH